MMRARVDLVHTDDFASADNPLNWWPRMTAARYQRYDWDSERVAEWHSIEPGGLVLLEGVSSWPCGVETPPDERRRRALARDGERMREQWRRWTADEMAWGDSELPWTRADVVVSGVAG